MGDTYEAYMSPTDQYRPLPPPPPPVRGRSVRGRPSLTVSDYIAADCPVAEELGRKAFYLPSGPALKPAQMKAVAEAVRDIRADR